jgi:hypothetical protein
MAAGKDRTDLLEDRRRARAVSGQVIWPNLMKPIGIAAGGLVLITIGLVIFFSFPRIEGWEVAVTPAYTCLIIGLIYLPIGALVALYLLVRMRRLIVGRDRLQLLSGLGRLIGQLPYNNISDIQGDLAGVRILLDNRRRKDTWWPRWLDDRTGYDVLLTRGFETDTTALHLALRDAVLAYRQKHGGPRWAKD